MATETLVYASPRNDKLTGERGYWVDDFDGAEAGMTIKVRLRSARANSRDVYAQLVRRITASTTGGPMWIAAKARPPAQAPSPQNGGEVADVGSDNGHVPSEPTEADQGAERFRSLEHIVLEAESLPGWVAKDIDTEWADGRCIRARIRLESHASIAAAPQVGRAPAGEDETGF